VHGSKAVKRWLGRRGYGWVLGSHDAVGIGERREEGREVNAEGFERKRDLFFFYLSAQKQFNAQ